MTKLEPITIQAKVAAPPADAWRAYTSPDSITQWNQASPDWHFPSADVDLREGGTHSVRMEARDGSFGFDFSGVYDKVEAPHALTLRLGDGRLVRTTFASDGQGTLVTTVFDSEETNPADMQREGWQAILGGYAVRVAQSAGRV